jgi:uncharacterized membrane protein YhaH (DUF805 family)
MEFMLLPLKRYADFNGRSRRMEYWMFQLAQMVFYFVLIMLFGGVAAIFGAASTAEDPSGAAVASAGIGVFVYVIAAFALLVPNLAVLVRRLHDQDKSGWMALLAFVPLVGPIILLVFTLLPGTSGPNQYGDDPKGGSLDTVFK